MTRKDFVAIAEAIKDARDALGFSDSIESRVLDSMAKSIANVCATTNPRFDRSKFLEACGVR